MELQTLTSIILPMLAQSATTVTGAVDVHVTGTPRDWPTIIIAITAVVIAAIALCSSIWEAMQNRTHNRLSVKPAMRFELTRGEYPKQGLYVANIGLGPAILKELFLIIDGKTYPLHSEKDWDTLRDLWQIEHTFITGAFIAKEAVISSDDRLGLFIITDLDELDIEYRRRFWAALSDFEIKIVVESFYKEEVKKSSVFHYPNYLKNEEPEDKAPSPKAQED